MVSEQDVLNLILKTAKEDLRIRAVFQTGSRVDPLVKRDMFQDFDFIFCVRSLEDFDSDNSFLQGFENKIFSYQPESKPGTIQYSLLLESGHKIDFTFYDVSEIMDLISKETLLVLHMDKDNLIQQVPVSSDLGYRLNRPTKNEFDLMALEFFHAVVEAIPQLYRGEPVSSSYLYRNVFDALNKMVGLFVADEKAYKVSLGKDYRFLVKNMDQELREIYEGCIPNRTFDGYWESLLRAMGLFRKCGLALANSLGYEYPKETDVKLTAHVRKTYQIAQRDNSLR